MNISKIEQLKKEYEIIRGLDAIAQITATFSFKKKLLESNDINILDFHLNLLKTKENTDLYYRMRACFSDRPKEKIETFLLDRLDKEQNNVLKADIIQILGHIKSAKILPYVREHIKSKDGNIRERCIIVLGWMGNKDDLPILNERLQNDTDDELRGEAATAMRQIWFAKRATAEDILPYLCHAVVKETAEETLSSIIIVIQDLLQRKFGLQERINEGIITGDPVKAKEKIIKEVNL
ncbi:HEAT repeat domain-containing protein [Treponema pedis]|uniref:HEAT repeat domain-containing protein n=1 Tax=Treponema pedis TaxID=409322 RepID=A0A7S6WMM8_9SPIR|nr:HEAT repeat domain-containing protein [Treponema pedis]QOW59965.1 HEAT repeat domain-containing protein [Treponema pedis]